jgi:hypothetical protein
MTKGLRKKHFQVWVALALLLPAGILIAWLAIPDRPPVKLLKEENEIILPVVLYTAGTKNFQAIIRTDQDRKNWQLEWQNKTVLAAPSAVIYKSTANAFDPATARLVGRIETKGRYFFPVDSIAAGEQHFQLVVYDFIHGQTLDSIKF